MDHYRNNMRGGRGNGPRHAMGSQRRPPQQRNQSGSGILGLGPMSPQSNMSNRNDMRSRGGQFSTLEQRSRNDYIGASNDDLSSSGGYETSRLRARANNSYWSNDEPSRDDDSLSVLMNNYGLSSSEVSELLKLPDSELNAANLSKVLESLKRKQSFGSSSFDNSRSPMRGSGSRGGRGGGYNDDRSGNMQKGILGAAPPISSMQSGARNSNYAGGRYKSDSNYDMASPRSSWNNSRSDSPMGRGRSPTFRRNRNSTNYDDGDDLNAFDGGGYKGGSGRRSGGPSLGRDAYSSNSSRYNDDGDDDVYMMRSSQRPQQRASRTAALRNEPRDARPRGLDDFSDRPPPLMGRKVPPSNSLLGDPPMHRSSMDRRPGGMNSSFGMRGGGRDGERSSSSSSGLLGSGAATALLNTINPQDPYLLGAQVRALKALQMEAIRMKQAQGGGGGMDHPHHHHRNNQRYSGGGGDRMGYNNNNEHRRPRSNNFPRSGNSNAAEGGDGFGAGGGKVVELENDQRVLGRKEKEALSTMREDKGRVIYMRFQSPNICEDDLKRLAKPYGTITRLFIIRAKAQMIMNQAFMELEHHENAISMLEHYMVHVPRIWGSKILMDRSKYREWKRKTYPNMRRRSQSPLRVGGKRARMSPSCNDKEQGKQDRSSSSIGDDINVSLTSSGSGANSSERRVTSKSGGGGGGDITKRLGPRGSSTVRGRGRRTASSAATTTRDLRDEIGNKKADDDDDVGEDEEAGDDVIDDAEAKHQQDEDDEEDMMNKAAGNESSSVVVDPLDHIADELAMNDDFVLMDEAGADEDSSNKQQQEDDDEVTAATEADDSSVLDVSNNGVGNSGDPLCDDPNIDVDVEVPNDDDDDDDDDDNVDGGEQNAEIDEETEEQKEDEKEEQEKNEDVPAAAPKEEEETCAGEDKEEEAGDNATETTEEAAAEA